MQAFIGLTVVFSVLLVTGQVLWKQGIIQVLGNTFEFSKLLHLITHPKIILGGGVYILATLLYFYLQTKYTFSKVQLAAIPLSMFVSMLAGYLIFNEILSKLNYFGALLVFVGVFLLATKSAG